MSGDGVPKVYAPVPDLERPENLLPCICGAMPERDAFDRYTVNSCCRCPNCGRAQVALYDSRGADVFAWNEEMRRIRGLIDAYPYRDECECEEAVRFLAGLSDERASLKEAYGHLAKALDVLITRAPQYSREDMVRIVDEIDRIMRVIRRNVGRMSSNGALILNMIERDSAKKKAEAEKKEEDE